MEFPALSLDFNIETALQSVWFIQLHVKSRLASAFLLRDTRQRKEFRTVYLRVVWSPVSKRFIKVLFLRFLAI